jgi:hypothetical protein
MSFFREDWEGVQLKMHQRISALACPEIELMLICEVRSRILSSNAHAWKVNFL